MINIDLHIHSFASQYKEGSNVVDRSIIANAEVLMAKLQQYEVGLFSITDHNRFWPELYERFDSLIATGTFPSVKGIVAGVEFDVQIDSAMGKCHIIAIFDAKNKPENYKKIYDALCNKMLVDKNAAYSREGFEDLLRDIGLDVILIASQRSGLDLHEGKHNSLSESTMNSEQLIMTGFINALEFQRPKVEGILLNNLKAIPNSVLLITGSDCHDWTEYPNHDSTNRNSQFHHTRAKILPTFKGLLMAVTSPETRINPQANRNRDYISSFSIGGVIYPLANGINAIIGENGSGKTTILKMLHDSCKDTYVKDLIEKNRISCESINTSKQLYVGQGDIVAKFDKNELFPRDNYKEIDTSEFREAYSKYADDILEYIKKAIKAKEALDQLSITTFKYDELESESRYFIRVDVDSNYSNVEDEHEKPNDDLRKIMKKILEMKANPYYFKYFQELDQIIALFRKIYSQVHRQHDQKTVERDIKNAIVSAAQEYETQVGIEASSRERDQRDYNRGRQSFISTVINAVKLNAEVHQFPNPPKPIHGYSTNPLHGFCFNSEANYHNKDVLSEFLSQMFVRDYATISALSKIDTYEKLIRAVKGCTDVVKIETQYRNNLNSFLELMCSCKYYIVDTSAGENSLGNTLGEMSLAYYKYIVEQENDRCIFLIDQPEDHISNNNISKKLLRYFNSIRNQKQIIMVTHNPLLVVNQDVDQVLFVKKVGSKIEVVSGCLEQEDEDTSILDIVAKNMDGGKESIEKRLRVYGKENQNNNVAL